MFGDKINDIMFRASVMGRRDGGSLADSDGTG